MAHYAKIVDGVVTNVIVAEQDFIDTQEGNWVQTSYNTYGGQHLLGGTPLRKNYAAVGMTYNSALDAFYEPKPFASWTLNQATCLWQAPVTCPQPSSSDGRALYDWDETNQKWVAV